MPVKDIQEWGVFRKNWMFVDRGEEAGGKYRNLYSFADVVNK